ncbi:MAG: dienelactone hydrolase family protein [Casimicrobiaceae bacterium]
MSDLKGYLAEEIVEDYVAGRVSRRQALRVLTGLTGAALAVSALEAAGAAGAAGPPLPKAEASPQPDATGISVRVAPDDPAVRAGAIRFAAADAEITGYLARPAETGAHPIVLVCHENRGLTPHIEDVARRLAKAGYVGMAVDLLSREGGTRTLDSEGIPALLGNAPADRAVGDFTSALRYLRTQPFAQGERVGMVGFCYGGGVTWRVAAVTPELRAAVPFYGSPVAVEAIPNIRAAVLAVYAGRDPRINATIPATGTAMQQAGKTYRKVVYPDAEHGFHNDTGARYDPAAAKAAWQETLSWFGRYLAG